MELSSLDYISSYKHGAPTKQAIQLISTIEYSLKNNYAFLNALGLLR